MDQKSAWGRTILRATRRIYTDISYMKKLRFFNTVLIVNIALLHTDPNGGATHGHSYLRIAQ